MESDRRKNTAQWFYSRIFGEESIPMAPPQEPLPTPLQAARSLEKGTTMWEGRNALFLSQGRLLADYEDDCEETVSAFHYFPTYRDLSDQELRSYFSWRTKLRRGELHKTSLSYVYLYLYELLNQIGVESPMAGYQKLLEFQKAYGALDDRVLAYLRSWRFDYVVYYGLDPALLAEDPQVVREQAIQVLETVQTQEIPQVMAAVRVLSSGWLNRSRFYRDHSAEYEEILVRVLRRMTERCALRCKHSFTEQYFGSLETAPVTLFQSAVFCNPKRRRNWEYVLRENWVYRCKNGLWTVTCRFPPPYPNSRMNSLVKLVDAVMREEFGYRYAIQREQCAKWLLTLVQKEVRAFLAEQKAREAEAEKKAREAQRLALDFSQLDRIRRDAAITQDRLAVEEEADLPEEPEAPPEEPEAPPETAEAPETPPEDAPLAGPEYRLVQCLLYGYPLDWVRGEGYLMSVLLDSVNEKLYDIFQDAVLEEGPQVVEDYIEELKEIVLP